MLKQLIQKERLVKKNTSLYKVYESTLKDSMPCVTWRIKAPEFTFQTMGLPPAAPSGCIIQPATTFVNCLCNTKISQ